MERGVTQAQTQLLSLLSTISTIVHSLSEENANCTERTIEYQQQYSVSEENTNCFELTKCYTGANSTLILAGFF